MRKVAETYDGTPCKTCGMTVRYQVSSACVNCRRVQRKTARCWQDSKHKDVRWKRHLQRRYGLSVEEHASLISQQNEKCAICCQTTTKLQVDHNHTSGVVRGLLCPSCNKALGLFKDSACLLRTAANYLEGRDL